MKPAKDGCHWKYQNPAEFCMERLYELHAEAMEAQWLQINFLRDIGIDADGPKREFSKGGMCVSSNRNRRYQDALRQVSKQNNKGDFGLKNKLLCLYIAIYNNKF